MALDLPPGQLSPAMEAYFKKCEEKLGFVPNVLLAYAFDNAKLEAFAAFYNDLMLAPSGLSKLEREMIAVVVSAQNRCYYCLTAHGAAVRTYSGDPALGEKMVMNYRAAKLTKKQRAMLDFSVKITNAVLRDRGRGPRRAAPRRILRSRHLRHRGGGGLLQHVEPRRERDRHAAERGLSWAGATGSDVAIGGRGLKSPPACPAISSGLRVPGATGKCSASTAPHCSIAATNPSAGRPSLIAAISDATALSHTSCVTFALMPPSAMIST